MKKMNLCEKEYGHSLCTFLLKNVFLNSSLLLGNTVITTIHQPSSQVIPLSLLPSFSSPLFLISFFISFFLFYVSLKIFKMFHKVMLLSQGEQVGPVLFLFSSSFPSSIFFFFTLQCFLGTIPQAVDFFERCGHPFASLFLSLSISFLLTFSSPIF